MRGTTRREFLRGGLLTALGAVLVCCTSREGPGSTIPEEPRRALPTATVPLPSAIREPRAAVGPRFTSTAGRTPVPELHEALYYLQLDDRWIQCQMCFRRCTVPEGGEGFCRNKTYIEGRYYTKVYCRPSSLQIDPIEKEPSFHMWPGATILCTGTASCNNRCKFCHNWHLSQRSFEEIEHTVITPAETVTLAWELGCDAVSFTYNEPTVFYEHMFDVAVAAKQAGWALCFTPTAA